MKKLCTMVAALLVAAMSFADVSYEYNGGWTNDYGWQNKQDMYETMNQMWNKYAGVKEDAANYTWKAIDSCATVQEGLTSACYADNIQKGMSILFFREAEVKTAYQWLLDYVKKVCTLQKKSTDIDSETTSAAAYLRYNLQSFFMSSDYAAYPYPANYKAYGNIDYFQSTWKHGFDNPTTVTDSFKLQTPYKEQVINGETVKYAFDGWYTNPEFTGDKVIWITPATTGKLYAKWIEYIPTISEVIEMPNDTVVKIKATTTFFEGTMAYLQDATAGIRVIFPADTKLAENTLFFVKGKKGVENGAPLFTVSEVISQEKTSAIVAIVADQVRFLPDYEGMLIKLEGKRVAGYSAAGDPSFRDDYDTIISYNLPINQNTFNIRRKADVIGVVERYIPYVAGTDSLSGLRIRAFVKNVTPSAPAGRDAHQYEAIPTGRVDAETGKAINYYLSNDWMFSNVLDNFNSNKPNDIASGSRSVVLHNGFLYFPNRDGNQPSYVNFKKVNIKDGDMFDAIPSADYLFRKGGQAGSDFVFGPANDLKKDNAGNVLAANLITSAKGEFQVWVMDDIDNGKGRLLIDETTLNDDYADNTTIRFDAIGVSGDVTKDAIVMAASANTGDVYYWNIQNGKWDGKHYCIKTKGEHNFSYAPQIFPIEGGMFYVDGYNDYPILFDMQGNNLGWFDTTDDGGMAPLVTNRNGQVRRTGHNGVVEFELGGEYFLVMAGGNTINKPASTFVLYKFADKERVFANMTQLWEFPYDGMGDTSNDVRVAVPCVRIVDEHTAKIAVYTNNNGYGVYTLSVDVADIPTDSQSATDESSKNLQNVRKVFRDGQVYILRNGKTYTITGVEVE